MMIASVLYAFTLLLFSKNILGAEKFITIGEDSPAVTVLDVYPQDTFKITCTYTNANVKTTPPGCFASADAKRAFFSNNPDTHTDTIVYAGDGSNADNFFTNMVTSSSTGEVLTGSATGATAVTSTLTLLEANTYKLYVGCSCDYTGEGSKMAWFRIHKSCPSDISTTCTATKQNCFDIGCNEIMCADSSQETSSSEDSN